MSKGNRNVMTTLGARNYAHGDRHKQDFYATEPKATELLLKLETFNKNIWECACGEGHISQVLIKAGYNVKSTDLINRGYGIGEIDFLSQHERWEGDIITNPPYAIGTDFIVKSLELINDGNKIAMFLPLRYLEGKMRKNLYVKHPPKIIYISSSRLACAINGEFEKMKGNAVCYAWFIWQRGYTGDTILKWFN